LPTSPIWKFDVFDEADSAPVDVAELGVSLHGAGNRRVGAELLQPRFETRRHRCASLLGRAHHVNVPAAGSEDDADVGAHDAAADDDYACAFLCHVP
jgi:hypothetical protein